MPVLVGLSINNVDMDWIGLRQTIHKHEFAVKQTSLDLIVGFDWTAKPLVVWGVNNVDV